MSNSQKKSKGSGKTKIERKEFKIRNNHEKKTGLLIVLIVRIIKTILMTMTVFKTSFSI